MKISGAEIIFELLKQQGVEMVAGIPGGAALPMYDALLASGIRHVLARHEQGAGFIAQGVARSTGKPGVCLVTSGPGATNLITALADARMDSVPVVAISGQVSSDLLGTDAFQEVDTFGMTMPITKHNFLVRDARELLDIIPEAFRLAKSGRPGPILVDVPKDVQTELIDIPEIPRPQTSIPTLPCDTDTIMSIARKIEDAKRPILYIGGGVSGQEAARSLRELAEKNSIPVVATLMGLDRMPRTHPLFLGLLGMHAARHTNMILEEADLILAIGVRFDDRATGKVKEFCPDADIVHIDIDRSEIDKIKPTNMSVIGDAGHALGALSWLVCQDLREEWLERISVLKSEFPCITEDCESPDKPLALIRCIEQTAKEDAIIATDVGQHQMWVAQAYPFKKPHSFLTSGGLGTMGFGMPTAIGAALANPEKQVICVSGDGSLLMNIQELATMAEQNLNVTVVVMNNHHLGLVRQQQELFYDSRYIASGFQVNPDFAEIAKGFGIRGVDLGKAEDPISALAEAIATPGPCLVNAPIDPTANVYPMVPPGAANKEMIEGESHA